MVHLLMVIDSQKATRVLTLKIAELSIVFLRLGGKLVVKVKKQVPFLYTTQDLEERVGHLFPQVAKAAAKIPLIAA